MRILPEMGGERTGMAGHATPTDPRDDDPLGRLAAELSRPGPHDAGRTERVARLFGECFSAIRALLVERYGEGPFGEEVASSAIRTALRRASDGEVVLDSPAGLERFLLQCALAKARTIRDRRAAALATDPADPTPDALRRDLARDEEGERAARVEAMRRELDAAIRRMDVYLRNTLHRRLFQNILARAYGATTLTLEEVAADCGCSERTARRVQEEFDLNWYPIIREHRRDLQELFLRLEEG
jgi:hypothetical protein